MEKIFDDIITMKSAKSMGSNVVSASAMKSVIQSWDWVLSIINLVYIDKIH